MTYIITDTPSPKASGEPDPDIVQIYTSHLRHLGYGSKLVGACVRTILHLITWLSASGKGIEVLDIRVLHQFLNHDCKCPGPHGFRKNLGRASWHLHRFLGHLIDTGRVSMPPEIETGGQEVESFLQTLVVQGYRPKTIVKIRKRCRHFIVWLYLNDIVLAGINDKVLLRFLSHDCTCVHPDFYSRNSTFSGSKSSQSMIGLFIDHLIRTGIAPPRPRPACKEPGHSLAHYRAWLRCYRGIGERTIQKYSRAMCALLPHLGDDPDRYDAILIRKTVQHRLETASRNLVRREMSVLRSYLHFVAMEGLCRPGLVDAVPTVPQQKFATLPRHLPREDIEQIITSCDRATPMGLRDHAILLLLARLALRVGDVANLCLDDIDWDNAVVRVSGKSRRAAALPLPQDIGDAVKDYILHARPVVETGNVFLRIRPPLHQPLSSSGVTEVARAAIKRSGVKAEGLPSGHVFRHSAATNMLREDVPLEVISSLLRHQSTQTTAIYARVDVNMLREVAQPWPIAGEVQ